MKTLSYILLTLVLTVKLSGQTIKEIDSLVKWIDNCHFTDTVYKYGTEKSKSDSLIGYVSCDTIKKIHVYNKDNSQIIIYYWKPHKMIDDVLFVKEFQGNQTNQYYFWDDSLVVSDNERYSEYSNKRVKDIFEKFDNYFSPIEFQYIDDQAQKFIFVGRLVEVPKMTPHCGVLAHALTIKIEVVDTDYKDYNNQYVLINQPCPEFLGDGYFIKNQKYKIFVATNDGVPFSYAVSNIYDEDIPIFWSRHIEKIE